MRTYPLPNDAAILAGENFNRNDLIEITIADSIEEGEAVSVINPSSAAILRQYDIDEYTAKIYSAFHVLE